jgi:hypothetical protein
MSSQERLYPLRKPEGHVPPIPRWQIEFEPRFEALHVVYLGLQCHESAARASCDALTAQLAARLAGGEDRPYSFETFKVLKGTDVPESTLWVAYWLEGEKCARWRAENRPADILAQAGADKARIGAWLEQFCIRPGRLETNYSGLDYIPGLARHPNASPHRHEYSAYWGAARDRIKDSGTNAFEDQFNPLALQDRPAGYGQRVTGAPFQNMTYIRSGQYWETCDADEKEAYTGKLQPTLVAGLQYLWDHPEETGTFGLRYIVNVDAQGQPLLETCGQGYYRSLGHLEHWAATHPSHLAIFHGAIAHAQAFGARRKLRTWHEVGILNAGEGSFEYVNCHPNTGVMPFLEMRVETI